MLWHYVQDGKSLGPIPEEQLKALLAAGTLRPTDLVWHDGMASWTAAQGIPELQPPVAAAPPKPIAYAPPPAAFAPPAPTPYMPPQANPMFPPQGEAQASVSPEAVELLRKTKPWVRLLGVLGMIGIVFMVLGALGIALMGFGPFKMMPLVARIGASAMYLVMALLYLPPVLFLNRYASRIGDLVDDGSSENLEQALRAQKSFWKYIGIFTAIMLCVSVLAMVGGLIIGVAMGSGSRLS